MRSFGINFPKNDYENIQSETCDDRKMCYTLYNTFIRTVIAVVNLFLSLCCLKS